MKEGGGNYLTAQSVGGKLASADFHGAELQVVRSKCVGRVGCKGIVVRDTKFTFEIITREDILKSAFGILFLWIFWCCSNDTNQLFQSVTPFFVSKYPNTCKKLAPNPKLLYQWGKGLGSFPVWSSNFMDRSSKIEPRTERRRNLN